MSACFLSLCSSPPSPPVSIALLACIFCVALLLTSHFTYASFSFPLLKSSSCSTSFYSFPLRFSIHSILSLRPHLRDFANPCLQSLHSCCSPLSVYSSPYSCSCWSRSLDYFLCSPDPPSFILPSSAPHSFSFPRSFLGSHSSSPPVSSPSSCFIFFSLLSL
jgi:hypothetical protein